MVLLLLLIKYTFSLIFRLASFDYIINGKEGRQLGSTQIKKAPKEDHSKYKIQDKLALRLAEEEGKFVFKINEEHHK